MSVVTICEQMHYDEKEICSGTTKFRLTITTMLLRQKIERRKSSTFI